MHRVFQSIRGAFGCLRVLTPSFHDPTRGGASGNRHCWLRSTFGGHYPATLVMGRVVWTPGSSYDNGLSAPWSTGVSSYPSTPCRPVWSVRRPHRCPPSGGWSRPPPLGCVHSRSRRPRRPVSGPRRQSNGSPPNRHWLTASSGDVGTIARPRTCRRLRWDNGRMTKSELIKRIAQTQSDLVERHVALAVNMMLDHMAACLAGGGRIEIRGSGSFSVRFRRARVGRNPRTGTPVSFPARYAPNFKPGKRLREPLNRAQQSTVNGPYG